MIPSPPGSTMTLILTLSRTPSTTYRNGVARARKVGASAARELLPPEGWVGRDVRRVVHDLLGRPIAWEQAITEA